MAVGGSDQQGAGQAQHRMKTPKAIMNAARDEKCLLDIVGVCNHDRQTTVACHLGDGSGGSSKLTGPLSIVFGCSSCHDRIDGRTTKPKMRPEDKEFYMRRGMMRTVNRLIDMGLVKIK